MIRVAILGASGYTALELCRLLLRHPEVEITALTTRQSGRPSLAEVHPALAGRLDLALEQLTTAEVAERADCVFSCLPHGASASAVATLLDADCSVIDFSADYRLRDVSVYEATYGVTHPDPERLPQTVYGLPELYRKRIKSARLVANPGCYPTAAILALAPLLRTNLISTDTIIVDSKSGASGAGRQPKPNLHFPECNENLAAYSVGSHRHTPEIDQVLCDMANHDSQTKNPVRVLFVPHLIPMDRGILSTCYGIPQDKISRESVLDILRDASQNEPFIRISESLHTTKQVVGSNFCDLTAQVVRDRVVVVSVIDNLLKGASGAAVQNFNLMHGFSETTALL